MSTLITVPEPFPLLLFALPFPVEHVALQLPRTTATAARLSAGLTATRRLSAGLAVAPATQLEGPGSGGLAAGLKLPGQGSHLLLLLQEVVFGAVVP